MIFEHLFPCKASEDALLARVPDMMRDHETARLQCVAPTQYQRDAVHSTVLSFAAAHGRKMYGAWALRQALLGCHDVDPGDTDPARCSAAPELEFYSPTPVADAIELADRLFAAGHHYVQAREAAAHGTYTLSVEFVRLCSITYAPKRLFTAIPTLPSQVPGVPPIVSPSFMIMDYLRVLCDPFTSYYRLDRSLPRLVMLQRHFPIAVPETTTHVLEATTATTDAAPVKIKIRPAMATAVAWAAGRPSCVSLVEHARAFFAKSVGLKPPRSVQQLTLVTVDYVADLVSLADMFGDSAHIVEHSELMGLLGRRSVLRVDGHIVMVLIDAAGRSVPVNGRSEDGLLVAGFSYCLLASMALRFLASVNSRPGTECTAVRFHSSVIGDLLAYRRKWSESGDSVCDVTSPFRDIELSYIGWPMSDMRFHMAMTDRRRVDVGSSRPTVWMTYDPSRPATKPYRYMMLRCDGEPVPTPFSTLTKTRLVASMEAKLETATLHPPPPAGDQAADDNINNAAAAATTTSDDVSSIHVRLPISLDP